MTIRVDSYDFDGCTGSHKALPPKGIAELNLALIKEKLSQADQYSSRFVVTGSNRQSYKIESNNAFNSGASIPVIRELAERTKSTFIPLTLADVCNRRMLGHYLSTYDKAMTAYDIDFDKSTNGFTMQTVNHCSGIELFEFDSFDFCDKKINLLFLQLQYFANHYPGKIEFNFYDDRGDIISALNKFFCANPSFLPKGVNLNLINYINNGKTHKKEHTLTGQADVDVDYEKTTRIMGEMAKAQGQVKKYDLSFITAEKIALYRANPKTIAPQKRALSKVSGGPSSFFTKGVATCQTEAASGAFDSSLTALPSVSSLIARRKARKLKALSSAPDGETPSAGLKTN